MRLAVLVLLALTNYSLCSVVPRNYPLSIPLKNQNALVANRESVIDKDALRRQLAKSSNKIQRGFAAYQKNTGSVHPSSSLGTLSKRQKTVYIPLESDSHGDANVWYGEIDVGTPEQKFTVALDTGSSDIFVPDVECSSFGCYGHNTYDASGSSTSHYLVGKKWSIQLDDEGSFAKGRLFNDTVHIGGLEATQQAVGAALKYSDDLNSESFPADGILGLAFPEISVFKAPTLLESLNAQKQLDVPQFGLKLAYPSELSLGGINFDLIDADTLVWTPVTQKGFWQIGFEDITVNGVPATTAKSAIIDTGSRLILGSSSNVYEFYKTIPGSRDASLTVGEGFYTYPCEANLDIKFIIEEQEFTLSTNNFNLGPVHHGSSQCVGGVAADDSAGLVDTWVIGDIFLSGVYTAFEFEDGQVGFANLL